MTYRFILSSFIYLFGSNVSNAFLINSLPKINNVVKTPKVYMNIDISPSQVIRDVAKRGWVVNGPIMILLTI